MLGPTDSTSGFESYAACFALPPPAAASHHLEMAFEEAVASVDMPIPLVDSLFEEGDDSWLHPLLVSELQALMPAPTQPATFPLVSDPLLGHAFHPPQLPLGPALELSSPAISCELAPTSSLITPADCAPPMLLAAWASPPAGAAASPPLPPLMTGRRDSLPVPSTPSPPVLYMQHLLPTAPVIFSGRPLPLAAQPRGTFAAAGAFMLATGTDGSSVMQGAGEKEEEEEEEGEEEETLSLSACAGDLPPSAAGVQQPAGVAGHHTKTSLFRGVAWRKDSRLYESCIFLDSKRYR